MDAENYPENQDFTIPDNFTYPAIGTAIGVIAVIALVICGLIFPADVSKMDRPQEIMHFITIAKAYQHQILLLITLDTIFIGGYLALFIGLYLMSRDFSDEIAIIGLIFGILTALLDILENALLVAMIQGINRGWLPGDGIYGTVWTINMLVDLLSYITILLFAIIYGTIYRPRSRKFTMAILLILYVIIGLISLIIPELLVIRSVFFIIGLAWTSWVLYNEEEIPTEMLEELVNQQETSRNDFIR